MQNPRRPGGANKNKGHQQPAKTPSPIIMSEGRNLVEYLTELYTNASQGKPLVQQSELRMSLPIANAQGQYTFQPVAGGQYAPNPVPLTDKYMDKADIFAVQEMQLFLTQRASMTVNATGYGQYLANDVYGEGDAELLTYPDNTLLDQYLVGTGGTQVVNLQNLYQFYNGYFTVVINSAQLYDYLPSADFLFVPQTQKDSINAAVTIPANYAVTGTVTNSQKTYNPFTNQRDDKSGFVKLANVLQFSGSGQNQITLNLPTHAGSQQQVAGTSAANMAVAGSSGPTYQNYVGIRMRGYLVKNRAY